MRRRVGQATGAAALAFATSVLLAGCFGGAPEPSDSARPSPDASTPPSTVAPLVLQPDASAEENLPFFDQVNAGVVAANADAGGRDFIDALVAAGFDKAAMSVTSDQTTLGEPADSIQFAVAFQGACLVGQYGPKSGGYHGAVRPVLGSGGCLIGQTRPIDW
ncbi:DUF6993 domain-containing protein [Agromyces sp. NPDC060279]|uniref:DUF6993 domain-containing protein n=1 Tax=Agromyces sp. NPDC060279 TaxID=3347092 RepID=UPI00366838B9